MDFYHYLADFLKLAIQEDIGDGDHTSLATIPTDKTGNAKLMAKQEGIIAGLHIIEKVFKKIDNSAEFRSLIKDGDKVCVGDTIATISGNVISLLQAERLALNILQRMSGIATQTNLYVQKLEGLKTKVLDTRKTTPGMRLLDKYAVKAGGGENHRIGLFDMILIKDNHIDYAGGIANALEKTKTYLKDNNKQLKIEIETRSIDDVKKVLSIGGVDRIMLDNFSIEDTRKAVELIGDKAETESSGGITIDNLRDYAECGVDFISVGALTHQIKSLDISMLAIDY